MFVGAGNRDAEGGMQGYGMPGSRSLTGFNKIYAGLISWADSEGVGMVIDLYLFH